MALVFHTSDDMKKDDFLKLVREQKLQVFVDKFHEVQAIDDTSEGKLKKLGLFSFLTGKVRGIKARSGQKALMDFLYALSESEKKSESQTEIKKIFDEQKKLAEGSKKYLGYGIPTEQGIKDLSGDSSSLKQLTEAEMAVKRADEFKTQKLIFHEMTDTLKKVYLENLAWVSFYKNVRQYIYNFKYKKSEKVVKDDLWEKFLTSNNLDELFDTYQQQQMTVGGQL
jgi:hypothetical protein